ncbi:MAG: carbohydrate ABC transporter permease [Treponema sp.]|nr:carbohydrate ABC transporter permease [Treponema sp.]
MITFKRGVVDIVFDVFLYVFFAAFTLICVVPFYYIFVQTISANDLVSKGQVLLLPRGVHFGNYIKIFELEALPGAALVSIARTAIGTFTHVLCTGFLGYMFTKKKIFARKIVYRYFVVTMYFGAGLIPTYLNMRLLHLDNTFLLYVIGVVGVYSAILIKTFIESIPASIEESAMIDGAGPFTIYGRLMIPMCMPILAVVAVWSAVGHWNSFMDTVIYIRDSRLYTLQFILWRYLNEVTMLTNRMNSADNIDMVDLMMQQARRLTPTSIKMTITMVVTFPVLFVYPFFQRYFVKGIMIGAIKG